MVTKKPVIFVGFDDIGEFNQKSTEWWWFGLDLKKVYLVATTEIH